MDCCWSECCYQLPPGSHLDILFLLLVPISDFGLFHECVFHLTFLLERVLKHEVS
jgi:hypothetical protein